MLGTMCKSKIHRAAVTGADLDDMGSIPIAPVPMGAAELMELGQVSVVNVVSHTRCGEAEMEGCRPRFIFVDEHNRISRDALRTVGA
jgi:aspartate 1-decarboxylase